MMSGIWLLACPLGMLAMGGFAWVVGRLPGKRAHRLRSAASRVTCMASGSAKPATVDVEAKVQEPGSPV
jgi:hypothetical protein